MTGDPPRNAIRATSHSAALIMPRRKLTPIFTHIRTADAVGGSASRNCGYVGCHSRYHASAMRAWTWNGTVFSTLVLTLALGGLRPRAAQPRETPKNALVRVPFVGCNSGGQAGPVEAPTEREKILQIDPKLARKLAYYKSGASPGVLAPRGWLCFGLYGSGGNETFVTPGPIDFFSDNWRNLMGQAVEVDFRNGGTSGRDSVARVNRTSFPEIQSIRPKRA